MDTSEKRMNPVVVNIINPGEKKPHRAGDKTTILLFLGPMSDCGGLGILAFVLFFFSLI